MTLIPNLKQVDFNNEDLLPVLLNETKDYKTSKTSAFKQFKSHQIFQKKSITEHLTYFFQQSFKYVGQHVLAFTVISVLMLGAGVYAAELVLPENSVFKPSNAYKQVIREFNDEPLEDVFYDKTSKLSTEDAAQLFTNSNRIEGSSYNIFTFEECNLDLVYPIDLNQDVRVTGQNSDPIGYKDLAFSTIVGSAALTPYAGQGTIESVAYLYGNSISISCSYLPVEIPFTSLQALSNEDFREISGWQISEDGISDFYRLESTAGIPNGQEVIVFKLKGLYYHVTYFEDNFDEYEFSSDEALLDFNALTLKQIDVVYKEYQNYTETSGESIVDTKFKQDYPYGQISRWEGSRRIPVNASDLEAGEYSDQQLGGNLTLSPNISTLWLSNDTSRIGKDFKFENYEETKTYYYQNQISANEFGRVFSVTPIVSQNHRLFLLFGSERISPYERIEKDQLPEYIRVSDRRGISIFKQDVPNEFSGNETTYYYVITPERFYSLSSNESTNVNDKTIISID